MKVPNLIAYNLQKVMDRISKAAVESGRKPEEIKLIVVTKTVDIQRIRAAIEAGATILGENYVQEAKEKIEILGQAVKWHLIGHLQRNKAKYAVTLFDMVHSLDSIPLAEELDRRACRKGTVVRVLIQVNISGEETKHGIDEKGIRELVSATTRMDNLKLEGFMTMPPYFEDPEKARPYFKTLRILRDRFREEGIDTKELSMGMSGDFEVAIQEGATLVRIGTAILGKRLSRT